MKYEWRKQEKCFYGAKEEPVVINVPEQKYIMIKGKGDPNDNVFSEKVSALFSLAYAIKMGYKALMKDNISSNVILDFTVYPLEGIWKGKDGKELIKKELEYTVMIRQPDFITRDMMNTAMEKVIKKKPNPYYESIYFDTQKDGKCVQILHIGSYDDEPSTFEKMDVYLKKNEFKRCEAWHREIYLNNGNRIIKSKLKTILRYVIE